MGLHTIVGSGGIISRELSGQLIQNNESLRLVARNPKPLAGAELIAADALDAGSLANAIKGSSIVYVCIGLRYRYAIWREQWPRIMENLVAACRSADAKMIFFDNVYMYGRVQGIMTEESPYEPVSRKGDLRARLATRLMSEVRKGNITATIARAADFYGPGIEKTGLANSLVFDNLAQHKKAQWLVDAARLHSFTYTPDAARGLYMLAKDDRSWNQVWHLPTAAAPPTGKIFVEWAAGALGTAPGLTVLPKWMISLAGIFNQDIREMKEMLYQYEFDYVFDSTKFNQAYGFEPTSYRQGIAATAAAYTDVNNKK